jgi:hypothetical protein
MKKLLASIALCGMLMTAAPAFADPNEPGNLTVTTVSETALDLTWDDTNTTEINYIVERSESAAGPFVEVAVLPPDTVVFHDSGLTPSKEYFYRVYATAPVVTNSTLAAASGVTLTPNLPPVAVDDNFTGTNGTIITGNVLSNDSDPDGNPISVLPQSGGGLNLNANGTFSYQAPAQGASFDFPYEITDGKATASAVIHFKLTPPQPLLAFPEAEGFGKNASGGRGGVAIQVTNLNNSGPGSLRACVEATGPRTCIFRVAGTISIDSKLTITSGNLTIAGQTAPGQGIAIKQGLNLDKVFHIRAPNVIIRHIHVRPGPTVATSDLVNCFGVETHTVVLDHISCSWATDQLMYTGPSNFITVQDSFFYEGLSHSTHTKSEHSKGTMFIGGGVSMIRNLISANSTIRCPNIEGSTTTYGAGDYEVRNNVTFNCVEGFFNIYNRNNVTKVDMVGNVIIRGPNTKVWSGDFKSSVYPMDIYDRLNIFGLSQGSTVCLQDNIAIGTFPLDRIYDILNPNDAHLVLSTNCYTNPVSRGMTGPAMPASQVEAWVLGNAGALPLHRDSADQRIATQIPLRQGAVIDHPSQVGGWPTLSGGTPYPDADVDGMDDTWEVSHGVTDPNTTETGQVYTNRERFLNELALTR